MRDDWFGDCPWERVIGAWRQHEAAGRTQQPQRKTEHGCKSTSFASCDSFFKEFLADIKNKTDPEYALVLLGAVILVASHAFYTVYAFEYYTMMFVGLGMAKVNSAKGY